MFKFPWHVSKFYQLNHHLQDVYSIRACSDLIRIASLRKIGRIIFKKVERYSNYKG